jgi:hypothetical protein
VQKRFDLFLDQSSRRGDRIFGARRERSGKQRGTQDKHCE